MSLFGHDNVIDYCNLEQTTLNLNVFPIGNEMIDIIQDYTYLEIRISSSGNFTFHLNIFHKKAFHPLFSQDATLNFVNWNLPLQVQFLTQWAWFHRFYLTIVKSDFKSCGVRTLFRKKNSRTFHGLSSTFPNFQGLHSVQKEPWVYVFFSSSTTWVILARRPFCVCSFLFVVVLKL